MRSDHTTAFQPSATMALQGSGDHGKQKSPQRQWIDLSDIHGPTCQEHGWPSDMVNCYHPSNITHSCQGYPHDKGLMPCVQNE